MSRAAQFRRLALPCLLLALLVAYVTRDSEEQAEMSSAPASSAPSLGPSIAASWGAAQRMVCRHEHRLPHGVVESPPVSRPLLCVVGDLAK